MSGYEDITPDQIIYLMHLVVLTTFLILLTRIVPAILQYKSMKFLEVKITTKQCDENKAFILLRGLLGWIQKKRKEKQGYHSYYSDVKRIPR